MIDKLKNFFSSVIGIKVVASIIFLAVALAVAKVSLSATFGITFFVVGMWIDEVIIGIFKLFKKEIK